MNRRGFLKNLGIGAGAAAVMVAPTFAKASDDFTHNGYRVKWSGWITPPNQDVRVGMWRALHGTRDLEWVSTTLGQCYPCRAWEVVDMTLARDWPRLTGFSTDAELDAAKKRALDALLAVL